MILLRSSPALLLSQRRGQLQQSGPCVGHNSLDWWLLHLSKNLFDLHCHTSDDNNNNEQAMQPVHVALQQCARSVMARPYMATVVSRLQAALSE